MQILENYLTLKQAAERCGLSYATLRREVDKGRLPAFRVGRKYFVAGAELDAYAAAQTQGGGYTVRQLMEILPLSYAFIIELIHDGRLPAVKQGRRFVVSAAALETFLEQARAGQFDQG